MALAAYNGGLGWVWRDQALAKRQGLDPARWWNSVETVNAGRSLAAKRQNTGYPRAILLKRQPKYLAWGPGVDMAKLEMLTSVFTRLDSRGSGVGLGRQIRLQSGRKRQRDHRTRARRQRCLRPKIPRRSNVCA
jgi:hypothetical protein